MLNVVFCL
jgi:hypothetical protein